MQDTLSKHDADIEVSDGLCGLLCRSVRRLCQLLGQEQPSELLQQRLQVPLRIFEVHCCVLRLVLAGMYRKGQFYFRLQEQQERLGQQLEQQQRRQRGQQQHGEPRQERSFKKAVPFADYLSDAGLLLPLASACNTISAALEQQQQQQEAGNEQQQGAGDDQQQQQQQQALDVLPLLFAAVHAHSKASGLPAAADPEEFDTQLLAAFLKLVCMLVDVMVRAHPEEDMLFHRYMRAALAAQQPAALAGTDLVAALEAGVRANAARGHVEQPRCEAVGLCCALVEESLKQHSQQTQQGNAAASQQQQQQQQGLFTLLLSLLKVTQASRASGESGDTVLSNLDWVLQFAEMAASGLVNGSSSSSSSSSSGNGNGSSGQVATWMLLIARGFTAIGQLQQAAAEDGLLIGLQAIDDALRWVRVHLPLLIEVHSSSAAAAAPEQQASSSSSSSSRVKATRLQLLQQLPAHLIQVQAGIARWRLAQPDTLRFTQSSCHELGMQLVSFGEALAAALPSRLCCNHTGCTNLGRLNEAELVAGRGCVCGRCFAARYCSKECQVAAWPLHRKMCKAIQHERQQQQQQQQQ
ncbi:hypothetical protein OEZ85_011190 [Tetradesmus obliquus]|uniref:MYND-type domain-containing protein n=1 Tax=Tetradesmus obliquus TaxID=3088 RepID=A0ABY8TPW1_TETOB|nr:hypothetical protein OEZ85_011190 [Tetradesmus obliquus]